MDNRSIFIANLGHEFKTPLNAVLGFSQLGMSTESLETCHDYFSKMNATAKEMIGMINAMMDYAQVADPAYQLDHSNFHLHSLLNQLPEMFYQLNHDPLATLTLHIEAEVPTLLESDPFRLEQAFKEIIKNTVTHAAGASMHVTVSVLDLPDSDKSLQIIFKDNGKGIPDTMMSQIFRPYHSLESPNQARYSGICLGLPLVFQIFERMNGLVELNNCDQGGLSIGLQLPIRHSHLPLPLLHYDDTATQNQNGVDLDNSIDAVDGITSQFNLDAFSDAEKIGVFNQLSALKEAIDLKKPMPCYHFLEEVKKKYAHLQPLQQFIVMLEPYIRHYQFNDASNLLDDYMSQFGGEAAYETHR